MRALIIKPDPDEVPGLVGEALAARGFALDEYTIQPDATHPGGDTDFPGLGEHDLLVVTGSPWSVYDPVIKGWVDRVLDHLRAAIAQDVPVLGICFGAQAMSAALGGKVSKADTPEFGWLEIESSIGPLCGPWFEFHEDVFTVPQRAERLAATDVGPQAFRIGRSLAVQFHPELTVDELVAWYASGEEGRLQHSGIDTGAVLAETRRREPDTRVRVGELIDWFLTGVARLS